jgi:hypothetical protein
MNNHGSPEKPNEQITAFTSRVVKLGSKERFEAALNDLITRSLQTEG